MQTLTIQDVVATWQRWQRKSVVHRLRQIERLVAEGEKQVARQQEIVSQLERDDLDTALAIEVLLALEDSQTLQIADRDQLREELSRL